jgi:hypothetical protein
LRRDIAETRNLPPIVRYQLLLRFPGDVFDEFEDIVELETALVERLGDLIALDGHDMGSDECRIALSTTDPEEAFRGMRPVLARKGALEAVVAAYRPVGARDYTVIWPEGAAAP